MPLNRKYIFNGIKFLIMIYCLVGIALYYLQGVFMFHPKPLPENHAYAFTQSFREQMIPVNATERISLVRFMPVTATRKGIVLYFHGNRDNISYYAGFSELFTKKGYELWMADYPGYGKSTGKLTEQKLYDLAMQVYKLAASTSPSDSIHIYGKSLGTAIATELASKVFCKQLILETPYYSIPDLFSSFAPMYPTKRMSDFQLPTYQFLAAVKEPVTIFHGTDDEVTFYKNAVKLKKYLKATDRFVRIEAGKHNNLSKYPEYLNAMDSLLN